MGTNADKQPYEAGSSFRPAFFFLDRAQRGALSAYYGFARAADDIADDRHSSSGEKRARLDAWRAGVDGLFSGNPPDTPLARDLARAIADFQLEKEHFTLLLEGMALDLDNARYATLPDLERYMFRVAGVVGLACLAICRYGAPKARLLAEKMGNAVQLTNIIRDVAEDYAAGRVYLPAEDLARFGCRPEDLGGSNYTPDFIELMKFEAARARAYYDEALALADAGQKRRLVPAIVMASLYRTLLEKVERGGFRVKQGRVRLGPAEKLGALFSAFKAYRRI